MPTMTKAYRFRMCPTPGQERHLFRMAGARRYVWNWALARRKAHYKATGKGLSYGTLAAELTTLKRLPETAWLKEADSQALQQALKDLDRAYANFFNPEMKAGFPRFKKRKRDLPRFRIPQRVAIDGNFVVIPKVGRVKIRLSRPVDLPTKSATFKRDATGRWFVTLTAEFAMPDVAVPTPCPSRVVGIDVGLKDFVVTSDGERIAAPKFYRKAQRALRKAQRRVSRRQQGSKRYAKAKQSVAKIHQRIKDRRGDFLHKLSTRLVRDHAGICIEDLSLRGLVRTKLAKSFHDASLGEFRRQLEYKSAWARVHLVPIGRFFPSSRLHGACGEINDHLTLSDREWTCGCGAIIDRDLNAAVNIKDEGLRILAAGQAGEEKRSGRSGKTSQVGAPVVEPRIPRL